MLTTFWNFGTNLEHLHTFQKLFRMEERKQCINRIKSQFLLRTYQILSVVIFLINIFPTSPRKTKEKKRGVITMITFSPLLV